MSAAVVAVLTFAAALLPQGAPPDPSQDVAPALAPAPAPGAVTATDAVPIEFVHRGELSRRGIVPVSVPFARGVLRPPARELPVATEVAIGGRAIAAPGLPMLRWPDGSIALLQVQPRVEVPAGATIAATVRVLLDEPGRARAFAAGPHRSLVREPLPLWTEVFDPWGTRYRAELEPDATAGPDGVVFDTGAMRLRRFRSAHRTIADAPGALFDLRAHLLTFDGERRAELTILLDNEDPLAGALGAVRFGAFCLATGDDALRFLPCFAAENLLPPAEPRRGGGYVQWLLRTDRHYLGDGTAKAWRFHLFQDGPDVDDAERQRARDLARPTAAFASLDAVRASGAFASFGGPAPLLVAPAGAAEEQILRWRLGARFGPFGSCGDPPNDFAPGHPRGGESALHNVLRWRSPELLQIAELMVLQHPLRPSAARRERQPPDTAPLRAGLGPLAQAAPHGFTPFSYEHCSATLLYDHWWLTGDALARDELARLGRSALALLRGAPFRTGRGEGNCLSAGVLCARATGDRALLDAFAAHAREVTLPALFPADRAAPLPQPPLSRVLDGQSEFDSTWQLAMLVRGLLALHDATGDRAFAAAVVRVADAMATVGWAPGEGPKTFFAAADVGRYTIAASPADRVGYDRMTIGAFVSAARLADDPEVAARLDACARFLLDRELPVDVAPPVVRALAADPWLQVAFDRREAQ